MLLKNNDTIWQQFVQSIMRANPLNEGSVEIKIGGESVTFTATHLAEVQEIFRNESWGGKAPKRKPVLGKTEDDEGEDEVFFLKERRVKG